MIPKIIHYCWFGGGEMPKEYHDYIAEWKLLHPDWEIKKWDESNSPADSMYYQNALMNRKWANLSNYVRFHALSSDGGIYLDVDMKVLKPLDELLGDECFLGFEEGDGEQKEFWVNNAIMGATKNHVFVQECLKELFVKYDGLEDANLSAPKLVTHLLKENYGLSQYGYQTIGEITLYPVNYFYPVHYSRAYLLNNLSENVFSETVAVHMWGRSWLSREKLIETIDYLSYRALELEKYTNGLEKINAEINRRLDEVIQSEECFRRKYNKLLNEMEKNGDDDV